MARFPVNDIVSLVGESPRHELGESLGPDLRVSDLLGADPTGFGDLQLGYGTAPGDPALRRAIARDHGVDADDVVVTVGGMHALFLAAFTLCEPGDEAVVAAPVFPLARNVLAGVGAVVRGLPFPFERGYRPDLEEFRALLSPRTRIVSLASPQNPSGVAIPRRTLREMIALMHELAPRAWLVLDETYREAAYGSDPVACSGADLGPRVVVVASLSKCHGAPGLRIGWAVTRDRALRADLVTAKFNTVISCSPVDEALALRLLSRREEILAGSRAHLARNLAQLEDWMRRHAELVDWVRPDAGALCCVRLAPALFDAAARERFHAALRRDGTRVAPGEWFGEAPGVFRLGFGWLDAAGLAAALDCLSAALDEGIGAPRASAS